MSVAIRLTAEGHAPLEGLCKLRTHVNELVLRRLESLLPVLHRLSYHRLDAGWLLGVEHVAHPFLVQVVPVPLVWKVLQQCRLFASILDEVFNGKALDLWNSSHLDCLSFYILQHEWRYDLPPCHLG